MKGGVQMTVLKVLLFPVALLWVLRWKLLAVGGIVWAVSWWNGHTF